MNLTLHFDPFPVLYSKRLVYRELTDADASEIYFLRSDPSVMKYIDRPVEESVESTLVHLAKIKADCANGTSICWGIAAKDNPSLVIGYIGIWRMQPEHFRTEIGYVLHPHHWRKGLISEALNKISSFALHELGFHSLEANINPENIASAAVLEKAGYLREAYFKENFFFGGKFLDSAVYSLVKKV